MTIFLCRHGNRFADGSDRDKPVLLTPKGEDQARRLAAFLRLMDIDIILSSPKARCLQTAIPTAFCLSKTIHVWPCLIEHNSYGPLDYSKEIYKVVDPDCKVNFNTGTPIPGTPEKETLEEAYVRAQRAVFSLEKETTKIAIFAHDCFNSLFLWAWLKRGCMTEKDRYRQSECCVNILKEGHPPLIDLNVLQM